MSLKPQYETQTIRLTLDNRGIWFHFDYAPLAGNLASIYDQEHHRHQTGASLTSLGMRIFTNELNTT